MRATLAIIADSPEEIAELGRVLDVEVESVTVGVRDELLTQELRPLWIEHVSIFVAEERDERTGPLIRIYIEPQEDQTDADANTGGEARGTEKGG